MNVSECSVRSRARVPALDGLRGLALLGVLLFHADGCLRGGYLGVDLFFVLSGYLITSLLLEEHGDTGRIALWTFWVRRARRLLPALLSLMPAVVAYARWLAPPEERAGIRADAIATLAYVANWRTIWADRSYWDLFSTPSPLEHAWSLAIEEQFYVVWPLVTIAALRWGSPRALRTVSLVGVALSMSAMWWLFDPSATSRAYLGTDTRAAAILMGAALATVMRPSVTSTAIPPRMLDLLGGGALVLLALAWWRLDGQDPLLYRGGLWATEVAALVLIACALAGERSVVARALCFKPLTLLGTLSYGSYLWHWPVYLVLSADRVPLPPLALNVLRIAVTFCVAVISYRFLEQPIRTRGVPFGRPLLVVPAVGALALLLVVGAIPAAPARPLLHASLIVPRVGSDRPVRVLLVGDSSSRSLGWSMRSLHATNVAVDLGGEDGFSVHNDGSKWVRWSDVARERRPDVSLVVLSGAFLYGHTSDGKWRLPCHPSWHVAFETALAARLRDLTSATHNVWAATVPYAVGRYDTAEFHAQIDCVNASLRKVVASLGGVRVLDLAQIHCPDGRCIRTIDGTPLRPDGVHYDVALAKPLAAAVLRQVFAAAPPLEPPHP